MSDLRIGPAFNSQPSWIEKLLEETPSPTPAKHNIASKKASLTGDRSPTEHVLRGSKSFAARSFRSRASGNSLRVPSNKENRSTTDAENSRASSGNQAPATGSTGSVLGELAPNGQILRPGGPFKIRPSPTPSLKKKKAEAIVKAHGSPQHVRVTAGGRIVPSEQSPLCHPRYGYSAIKANGGLVKFAPNHPLGKAQWTQATQNGFVAQDVEGRLCQIVNGTILPLNEVDGALRLYVPAPNLNISSRGSSFGPPAHGRVGTNGTNGNQQHPPSQSKTNAATDPPLPAQTNALELEYSKLEHELKELDKTEALHGRTMNKTARDALIGKRRELVVTLDNIRKAIKSIKNAQPPEAPTSPRAMRNQQSTSPPKNRLPAFLKQRAPNNNDMVMPPMPPNFNQFFGMGQPQQFNGQYGFQPTPPPDVPFPQPFAMPPGAMFVPPPPFDGSMGQPFAPYAEPMANGVPGVQPSQPNGGSNDASSRIPQNDGARSYADLQKVGSPRQSHALDIKAPEPKPATALKSTLNPMSPAYKPGNGVLKAAGNANRQVPKPVKDRVPTPLSPLHQLRPSAAANNAARGSVDTISPTKKSPHLHSSSISSFETADFFPRNTREYSTRQYAYPDQSEDKENVSPLHSTENAAGSPATPVSDPAETFNTKTVDFKAPAPPPGTPVSKESSGEKAALPIQITEPRHLDFAAVPDRQTHNLSPKTKRQDFLFVEEHPSQYSIQTSSSPQKFESCDEETTSPVDQIDFTEASTEWIEGYRAGLARKPVGSDRQGECLDGYCAGLLKSKPVNIGPSTGSPMKSSSRRPSPGLVPSRSSSRLQAERREAVVVTRPPFENSLKSMDTLKEAVFAPQNEDVLLSPSAEAPHANEPSFNLGAWAQNHPQPPPPTSVESLASGRGDGLAGFPFPYRTASMMKRQGVMSEDDAAKLQAPAAEPSRAISVSSDVSNPHQSANSSTMHNSQGNRVSSMTSIDSNLYRQYPGHRVFSPHLEWKSATSIAQAAGLAAAGGFSGGAQVDGPPHPTALPTTKEDNPTRFKEESSLEGHTSPPPLPPKDTSSPKKDATKPPSPAKAKFEHIAEKVGIKVAATTSPPGKRRWRDVWRGAGGMSKDEAAPPASSSN